MDVFMPIWAEFLMIVGCLLKGFPVRSDMIATLWLQILIIKSLVHKTWYFLKPYYDNFRFYVTSQQSVYSFPDFSCFQNKGKRKWPQLCYLMSNFRILFCNRQFTCSTNTLLQHAAEIIKHKNVTAFYSLSRYQLFDIFVNLLKRGMFYQRLAICTDFVETIRRPISIE